MRRKQDTKFLRDLHRGVGCGGEDERPRERGEAEPETDGREGLKSLEVLIATYLSARDGRRVALPLDY